MKTEEQNERLLTAYEINQILNTMPTKFVTEAVLDLIVAVVKAQDFKSYEAGKKEIAREIFEALEQFSHTEYGGQNIPLWQVAKYNQYKSLKARYGLEDKQNG